MTDRELIHELNVKENQEEYTEESLQQSCLNLKIANENQKQIIYDLRRKIELDNAMLREIQERNEFLEQSLEEIREKEKIIGEAAETRHRESTNEYKSIIANLETKLATKTLENEELQETIQKNHALLSEIKNRETCSEAEIDVVDLENRLEEITSLLREETGRREQADTTIAKLKDRCEEFENKSRLANEHLAEKNHALQNAREELAVMRTEIFSLKAEPASESAKGNSLFAEVEDRRRTAIDTLKTLREKYASAKRVCKIKIAEVKVLRAQQLTMYKKWENDSGDSLAENERLLHMYKIRISELETQLKLQSQKLIDDKLPQMSDFSYEYFQTLLSKKKKEVEDLQLKVEDLAIRMLVQEEAKCDLSKQLRFWRYKANSLEAELELKKVEEELGPINDALNTPSPTKSTNSEAASDHATDNKSAMTSSEEPTISSKEKREVHFEKQIRETSKKMVEFSLDTAIEPNKLIEPAKRPTKKNKEYPIFYIPNESTD